MGSRVRTCVDTPILDTLHLPFTDHSRRVARQRSHQPPDYRTKLGVPDPPRTEKELTERIAAYRAELASTAEARAAARFLLLNPPLPVMARPPYGLLAAAAVSLLPGWARWPLRLPHLPGAEAAVIRPAGRAMVQAIRWATAARPATEAS